MSEREDDDDLHPMPPRANVDAAAMANVGRHLSKFMR
jgi:hypothetical protein